MLEDFNILLKGITKTIKDETKEQKKKKKKKKKKRFLGMLLGTFRASLLGNMLAGNGILKAQRQIWDILQGASSVRV